MPGGYCSVIAQNTQLSGYVNITCNCLFIGNVITNWAFLLFEGIVQICAFSILQCTYFDVSALWYALICAFVRCQCARALCLPCSASAALGRRKDWVNKRSSGAHSSCQHWWWSTWSTWWRWGQQWRIVTKIVRVLWMTKRETLPSNQMFQPVAYQ